MCVGVPRDQQTAPLSRTHLFVIFLILSFAPTEPTHAQVVAHDLWGAIFKGTVTLVEARGNGASSGASVEGILENTTAGELHIDVFLSKPLFLVNRGAGQNMLAIQVYRRDQGYRSDGKNSFITLKPRQRLPVTFVAFCVDFDKENPRPSETFAMSSPPAAIENVMRNIISFARLNPDQDITVPAQVAVWLAQGKSPGAITDKLNFSPIDERLARSFLQ